MSYTNYTSALLPDADVPQKVTLKTDMPDSTSYTFDKSEVIAYRDAGILSDEFLVAVSHASFEQNKSDVHIVTSVSKKALKELSDVVGCKVAFGYVSGAPCNVSHDLNNFPQVAATNVFNKEFISLVKVMANESKSKLIDVPNMSIDGVSAGTETEKHFISVTKKYGNVSVDVQKMGKA